jgi:hypothetical protein
MTPDETNRHILHDVDQEAIGAAMQETFDAVQADGGLDKISGEVKDAHFKEFRRKLHSLVIRKKGIDISEEQMTPYAQGLFRNCFRDGQPLHDFRERIGEPANVDRTANPDAEDVA